MIYAFRIRPLVRLFLAAVMVWFAFTCMNATRVVPTDKAVLLVLVSALSFLGALITLVGLSRLTRAYGRTWRG
jgi:hypothetical protein